MMISQTRCRALQAGHFLNLSSSDPSSSAEIPHHIKWRSQTVIFQCPLCDRLDQELLMLTITTNSSLQKLAEKYAAMHAQILKDLRESAVLTTLYASAYDTAQERKMTRAAQAVAGESAEKLHVLRRLDQLELVCDALSKERGFRGDWEQDGELVKTRSFEMNP
jgi:hypothetical protein